MPEKTLTASASERILIALTEAVPMERMFLL